MDGFVFVILVFAAFVFIMLFAAYSVKGRMGVYLKAVTATLSGWFVGLLLDANIDFGDPAGFLSFRTLLPVLAMGLCILHAVNKNQSDE